MTILTWELRNFASCLEDSPCSSLESQCLFVMWGRWSDTLSEIHARTTSFIVPILFIQGV